MTASSDAPSWRNENAELTRLAWPTLASTLSVPLVGLADTLMVGQLPGAAPLAAVAMGGAVYGFVMTALSPCRGLAIAMTGRWFGRGEADTAVDWTLWGLALSLVAGGALVAAGPAIAEASLAVFAAEGRLRDAFTTYLTIRFVEVPFVVAQMFLLGHLRGAQRAVGPMAVTLAVAALNVGFNALFIFGLGLGVAGAAWGSVAANALGTALALLAWWTALKPRVDARRLVGRWRLLAALRGAFGWGVARSVLLMGALAVFAAAASHLGASAIAAHGVLMQLWLLSSYAIDGFAYGMEGLVARRLGEEDTERLRLTAWIGLAWCVGIGGLFTAAYVLFGAPIASAFSVEPAVVAQMLPVLGLVAALQPVVAIAYWADGLLNAAVALRAAFSTLAVGVAACALVLPLSRHGGLVGVWWGLVAFSVARSLWALWVSRLYLLRG